MVSPYGGGRIRLLPSCGVLGSESGLTGTDPLTVIESPPGAGGPRPSPSPIPGRRLLLWRQFRTVPERNYQVSA